MNAPARVEGAVPAPVSLWRQWVRQPRTLAARRIVFQVHGWTGVAIGLYIALIGVSGSALVFRVELASAFAPDPLVVSSSGERLANEALTRAAEQAFPGYHVENIWPTKLPDHAVEVGLRRDAATMVRLFDPYTGRDLGYAVPLVLRSLRWLIDFHATLLGAEQGRTLNAVGGLFTMILCLTGIVVWWPGSHQWRRSLTIGRATAGRPVSWRVHSAFGFWTFALLLLWAVSGVFLAYQQPFLDAVDYFEPFDGTSLEMRTGDELLMWFGRLHFGRYWGTLTKVIWTLAGLVPAVLFVTGFTLWWRRQRSRETSGTDPAFRA